LNAASHRPCCLRRHHGASALRGRASGSRGDRQSAAPWPAVVLIGPASAAALIRSGSLRG
jgi:hypothetical protein